jgi:peptide/nickel transport system substrate-binding protein
MRRLVRLAIITALLGPTACGGNADRPASGADATAYATDATFRMGLTLDPGAFDPYRSQLIFGSAYIAYDSLLNLRPDGRFVSGLAEHWEATPTSAQFTLRPDVTCSDGHKLTASDVAKAINFVSNPKNQSPQYGVNTPTVAVTATGTDASRTVNITLSEPFGFLLHTIGQLPIVCPSGLDDPRRLATGSAGTGPFVLSKVVPGQSYTFTVRTDYRWGPDGASTTEPGTPKTIELRIVENESTAANLLLSGDLNYAQIGGEDRKRLEARGVSRVDQAYSGAWLWMNHLKQRPTADRRIRQALIHALDLQAVTKVNTGGSGSPSTGLVALEPKACKSGAITGRLPAHDVAAADTLLDQAGWAKGADGIRRLNGRPLTLNLHYLVSGSVFEKPTAELIAQSWQRVGAQVKLTADTRADQNRTMFETGDYDIYLRGFGMFLPSQAVPYVSGAVPPDGTNLSGIANNEYNQLVAKAARLTPPDACKYWAQAEEALYRNVDVAPIADRPQTFYVQRALAKITAFNIPIPTSIRVLQ